MEWKLQFSTRSLLWLTVTVALFCFASRLFPNLWRVVVGAVVIGFILWWFDPHEREARHYGRLLADRKETNDEELFTQYFTPTEMSRDIPGKVRRIFAKHMDYPAEKMLPDDDLNFFWDDVDLEPVVLDVQADFGITIVSEDLSLPCTIRTFCDVIQRKCTQMRPFVAFSVKSPGTH